MNKYLHNFKNYILNLWCEPLSCLVRLSLCFIIAFTFALVLTGCHTTQPTIVAPRVTRDTTQMTVIKYDSIYIDRWQTLEHRADTVYKEAVRTEYRYRLLHDTIREVRIDSIPVIQRVEVVRKVRYTPWFTRILASLGAVLLVVIAGKNISTLRKFIL